MEKNKKESTGLLGRLEEEVYYQYVTENSQRQTHQGVQSGHEPKPREVMGRGREAKNT